MLTPGEASRQSCPCRRWTPGPHQPAGGPVKLPSLYRAARSPPSVFPFPNEPPAPSRLMQRLVLFSRGRRGRTFEVGWSAWSGIPHKQGVRAGLKMGARHVWQPGISAPRSSCGCGLHRRCRSRTRRRVGRLSQPTNPGGLPDLNGEHGRSPRCCSLIGLKFYSGDRWRHRRSRGDRRRPGRRGRRSAPGTPAPSLRCLTVFVQVAVEAR